jgi:hypothetical protein
MDRTSRLRLVGNITYYLGWISLVCGGLVHVHIATAFFLSLRMTKRNLLETAVMCFIICVASEVRTLGAAEKELPVVVKRPVAA